MFITMHNEQRTKVGDNRPWTDKRDLLSMDETKRMASVCSATLIKVKTITTRNEVD
jgi:hypothetical protein